MRKTTIAILIVFAMVASVGVATAQTTFKSYWDGSGNFEIHFQSGDDAINDFSTSGANIKGEYHAIDKDDNPYNYNVDTTDVKVKANVEYGGFIRYNFTRTDSYTRMYGNAGQNSYTYITTSDTANFRWHSWSNFAEYRSKNYGWQNSNQIQATGNHFIYHYIDNGNDEGAEIAIDVDGNTDLTIMNEEANSNGFSFGKGCGCYRNAHADITGAGDFTLNAYADHTIDTDFGIHTDGYLGIHAEFTSSFHFGNFALSGN